MNDSADINAAAATRDLISNLASRRSFLKAGAAMTVAAGVGFTALPTLAEDDDPSTVKDIFTVARTAEQLAVTFYTNGVRNAAVLGLAASEVEYLKAALIEEQIHQTFFTANGGNSLAATFSFPDGEETFENLNKFIATQQQLEGVFDAAFLAAVREFAEMETKGSPRLAQIAAQIAMVESEHRVLGREIAASHGISVLGPPAMGQGTSPADNWTYAPAVLDFVKNAPGVVAAAGYLSPKAGNTFAYRRVFFDGSGQDTLGLSGVAKNILYKDGPPAARP
jgi:hypothetical protein